MWEPVADWLISTYPEDILMPVKPGTKHPLFPHRNGEWTWSMFEKYMSGDTLCDIGILLRNICVLDVDSPDLVTELETRFPVLRTCPCEATSKGRHYFFSRSPLCIELEFMDQRSSVIPRVDFKTQCSTGTSGLLLVAPSSGKRWIRTPWALGDILAEIPNDLLQAVAVPMKKVPRITFTFADERLIRYCNPLSSLHTSNPTGIWKLSNEVLNCV